jgi:CheY-like chemotaxis protein
LTGVRVLVCEDDEDARALLVQVLEAQGALVRATSNAGDALDAFDTAHPDVLVSDIGLPHIDGYALIGRVRELPVERGGRTPAIALTAYARGDDARKAFHAGYQLHMAKPLQARELVTLVADLAGRAQSMPA